jgi:hypothetical protein
MPSWPQISRDDLKVAAKEAGFDMVLPILIRRLIAETGGGITELDMPGGSGTAAGGFDGVVTATHATSFVPAGRSVWELSISSKSGKAGVSKADDDYEKRTEGPSGTSAGQCTYVQLILEPWTKAREWAAGRTNEGRWIQVRGYNLDAVHAWLEVAPATTAWLADQLGKGLAGIQAVETWWERTWMPSTTIPLHAGIVLAGRQRAAADLVEMLTAGERTITLGGDLRPDDARAFAAAVLGGGPPGAETLGARALFVSEPNSLNQLVKQSQPLVLVLTDSTVAQGMPLLHPHQLILLTSPGSEANVDVPPLDGSVVASMLEDRGVPREQAAGLGQLARRSLLALRRSLAVTPALLTPSWSVSPDIVLRRLLLLGAWDGDSTPDRELITRCVGRSYADIQEAALALQAVSEMPFLAHVDEHWHVLSPKDAWTLLNGSLTRDDLEAFEAAARQVLCEHDPRLDIPAEDRWQAGLMGVHHTYSATLRSALARGLALLGGDASSRGIGGKIPSQWANLIVRQILHEANGDSSYQLWTSLGDVLPLLAEAAPDAFIDAMTAGLAGNRPQHALMFQDGEEAILGGPNASSHVDFVWALESLAWSPQYFDDAVEILAELAAVDPEPVGGWSQRPITSLVGIFRSGSPRTSADLGQRVRAIERLYRRRPVVARRLMLDLIPDGRGFVISHDGPWFRDWQKDRAPVTRTDITTFVGRVVEMLLEDLDHDPERFLGLVGKVSLLSVERRAAFAQRLETLATRLVDEQARSAVFEAVRGVVAKHRAYANSGWSLPEDQLQLLETAAAGLGPEDPALRHAWLFASDWIDLEGLSHSDDFDAYQGAVNERRAAAVAEVGADGLDRVEALALTTDYPGLVGIALARCPLQLDADMLAWLESGQASQQAMAFAYIGERMRAGGTGLRDEFISKTDDAVAQAQILRATSDPVSAWSKLQELPSEVGEQYWREFNYFELGSSFPHVAEAARSLTHVGRHAAALDLLAMYLTMQEESVDSAEAAKIAVHALESLMANGIDDPEFPRLQQWDFERLFPLLGKYRDEIGPLRLAHIEWQFFPVLGLDPDAPTLHAALAERPTFFVELVSLVFRPDADQQPPADEGQGERQRDLATRAYEVLDSWRRCPGVGADGRLDSDGLVAWVRAAREQLRAVHRLGPGDGQIGHILAFAPEDDDGMCPARAVRDLLEDVRSRRLESGLGIGIMNRRRTTIRDPLQGGGLEWKLAQSYRKQAESATHWPRTRRVFTKIAESYEAEARDEDVEAEHLRRGL